MGKRIVKHKKGRGSRFTGDYEVNKLVYYETLKNLEEAVKREKQLKKWRRQWKINLIEKQNPEWEDLFREVIKTGPPVAEPK